LRLGAPFATLIGGHRDIHGIWRSNGFLDSPRDPLMQLLIALISGTVFGLGLSISEMINPARVIGFLDIAGHWDPTLLLVMCGALAVTVPLYPLALRRRAPLFDQNFFLPTKRDIDAPLIFGAAIFGIGWGLGGFCPGPALAALATGSVNVLLFVLAMAAGQWFAGRFA
jgi:uncharacterized membrane protein YedE/YeeE